MFTVADVGGARSRSKLRAMGRGVRWIGGAVAVACVAGVGYGCWRAWFGTRDATTRTVAELHDTRTELARVEDDLDAALADLADAQATLSDGLTARDARRSERDAAQRALDEAIALLGDAQAKLATSRTELLNQTATLDAFDRCLQGVSEALNQIAVGDTSGFRATISGVEGVCATAGASL